jgi:hypothetical protein
MNDNFPESAQMAHHAINATHTRAIPDSFVSREMKMRSSICCGNFSDGKLPGPFLWWSATFFGVEAARFCCIHREQPKSALIWSSGGPVWVPSVGIWGMPARAELLATARHHKTPSSQTSVSLKYETESQRTKLASQNHAYTIFNNSALKLLSNFKKTNFEYTI